MTVTVFVMSTWPRTPPPDEIREIARVAIAHERTVERRLLGRHVRGAVSDRVDAELARRGYLDSSPPPPERR